MKRIIVLALAIAALSFVLASTANATCLQVGEIVRVVTTPGAGITTIYLRNTPLTPFAWSANTPDLKIATMAAAIAANRNRVQISATAAQCPTPVAGAILPMGVIGTLTLHP